MSVQVENLEKNTAKLTIEVPAEKFEEAVQHSYNKNKGKFNIPGFRKGKAPFNMIKKMYGVGVFYEDAVDEVIDASYPDAAKESGLEIVSRPAVSIEQIEEGKSFIYTAKVAVKPEVTLGQYKGVEVQKTKSDVTEEDIETEIKRAREKNSRLITVEDRGIEDGDQVTIDFDGSVDGKRFEGGKAEHYSLTLGSGTFVDGFEDQIVGHTPGETFDVTVTFPEGYSDSTDSEGNTVVLSGKKAVFSVTLNYISEKVLPELTDAWVAENYGESDDVHTVEELKALYQKMLYNTNLQNAIMDDLLANSTFKELPKEVTDYQVNQCLNYYYTMANYYGYDLDSFVQTAAGYENADDLLEGMSDSITTYSKEALLYQAVAEALDIVPTQEQIDTYSSYTDTYGENYCTMVALMDAVTDALTESAVVS